MPSTNFSNNYRMTSSHVDKVMAQRRRNENDINDLLQYRTTTQLQSLHNQSDHLVVNTRRKNQLAQMAAENMLDDKIIKLKELKDNKKKYLQDQEILYKQEEEKKRIIEKKEKEIQRICDNSEELRELQTLLNTAYMNKERAIQQAQKTTIQIIEKKREKAMDEQMEYDRQMALAQLTNKEIEKKLIAIEGKQDIQQQMIDRLKLKEESAKEAEIDKAKVNDIIKKIQLEDAKEIEKHQLKIIQTRELFDHYRKEREKEIENKLKYDKEEEDKILQYEKFKREKEAIVKAKYDEKKKREDEQFKVVENEIKKKQREEEEMNRIRDELWEEELYEERKRKEELIKLTKAKEIEDMIQSNINQQQLKQQILNEKRMEEDKYNEYLKNKYKNDLEKEKKELLDKEIQKDNYKKEIEYQNKLKHEQYLNELKLEELQYKNIKQEEEYKKKVIEEAKKRLLMEHAKELQGYLPKGITLPIDNNNNNNNNNNNHINRNNQSSVASLIGGTSNMNINTDGRRRLR